MVTVAEGLVRSSLDFRHLAGTILNPGGLCFSGSLAFWELYGNQIFRKQLSAGSREQRVKRQHQNSNHQYTSRKKASQVQ